MATVYEICAATDNPATEVWQDIDTLGIVDPVRTRLLSGTDTLSFNVESADALTADALFAFHAQIRFRRVVDGGTPELLFLGRCYPADRGADGPSERYHVEIRGMWDWIEKAPMRQTWTEQEGSISKPRVILFCAADGSRMSTGAQIEECIAAARAAGCPCAEPAEGDIMAGYTPPFDEQINISIAQALGKALANHPHAACWFDYSERSPRLYVRTRQSLTAVSVDVAGNTGVRVRARNDLQPPAVAVAFEKEHVVDGQSWRQTTIQHAPVIAEESAEETNTRLRQADVLWGVFDLDGSSRQTVSQKIETENFDFETDLADKAWWKAKVPWLADYADADITLANPARDGELNLIRILTKGAIQGWMLSSVEREMFSVDARLTRRVGEDIVEIHDERLSVEMLMTSASTRTYRITTNYDSGESIPEGVAAAMWAEWQQLHHEGNISIVEEEPSLTLAPGKTLNLTSGRAEWSTMAAMITRVTEHFAAGQTMCEFGVPGWIDLDSRVAWQRATRTRRYAYSRTLRDSSSDDGGGGIDDTQSIRDGSDVASVTRRRIFDPDAVPRHEIDLDGQSIVFATPAHAETLRTIKPREVPVLARDGEGNLVAQTAQALLSEPYGDPEPVGSGGGDPDPPAAPSYYATLGSNAKGAEAASTDTWTAGDLDGSSNPLGLYLWVQTRQGYYDAGDKKWYAYARRLIYATDGRLYSASAETRIEIHAPVSLNDVLDDMGLV